MAKAVLRVSDDKHYILNPISRFVTLLLYNIFFCNINQLRSALFFNISMESFSKVVPFILRTLISIAHTIHNGAYFQFITLWRWSRWKRYWWIKNIRVLKLATGLGSMYCITSWRRCIKLYLLKQLLFTDAKRRESIVVRVFLPAKRLFY